LKASSPILAAIAVLIATVLLVGGASGQSAPADSQTPPQTAAPAPAQTGSSAAPAPAEAPPVSPPATSGQTAPIPVAPAPAAPAQPAPADATPAQAAPAETPPAPDQARTPTPEAQATLRLSAGLNGGISPLTGGLRWRIFATTPEEDGTHPLIAESSMAEPTMTLAPGDYVVHAAFGLASATRRVKLGADVRSERLMLSAGALKVEGTVAGQPIDPSKLSLSIYVPEGRNPEGKLVYSKAKPGEIVGLPEGSYHIVSTYLDMTSAKFSTNPQTSASAKAAAAGASAALPSNSIVTADIRIPSGKLIDVTLRHRCASLTLKLVNHPGGEALPNTTFTVLTPGGDVIRELMGAFPSLVLAEGEYVAIARHDAKTYQSTFMVKSGMDHDVEVVAQQDDKDPPGDKAATDDKE